ncbi:MAG: tetratricopeptide repeat protein, partial [Desulfovibrionaceae bacterium]|nr:tetratricopeptide repeat protein [Desulfovibrionaceae bacterium]
QALNYKGLGDCYKIGRGTSQNIEKATYWYRKAVELGNARAAMALGEIAELYNNSYVKALSWYEKAVELGFQDEKVKTAIERVQSKVEQTQPADSDKYEQVLKSYQEASRLFGNEKYKEAKVYLERVLDCTSDDDRMLDIKAECAIYLGNIYFYGLGGVPEDNYTAFKLFSSSVSRVENLSKFLQIDNYIALGHCYRDGRGTSQNIEKARYWYRKAVELGDASAAKCLGVIGALQ